MAIYRVMLERPSACFSDTEDMVCCNRADGGYYIAICTAPTNEAGLTFRINLLNLDGRSAANMNVEYTDD